MEQIKYQIDPALVRRAGQLIDQADIVHVYTHVYPDGDAVGSVRALELVLTQMGKKVVCRFNEPLPEEYEWLGINVITAKLLPKPDLIVTLDADNMALFGNFASQIQTHIDEGVPLLNIDHHPSNHHYGQVNVVHHTSSTTQILYVLWLELGVVIDKPIATALLYGLIYDTSSFQRSNTDALAFQNAAEFTRLGANPYFISQKIYKHRSVSEMRLWGEVLSGLEGYCDESLIVAVVTKEIFSQYKTDHSVLVGLVNFLTNLEQARIIMLLKETEDGEFRISLRSDPIFDVDELPTFDTIDVSRIAREFGGGGHLPAAGCVIDEPLEVVKDQILRVCLQALGKDCL